MGWLALNQNTPAEEEFPKQQPLPYLSAEDELKTFHLPDGYSMELVVGDPVIAEPTTAVFDADGRMYVGEMRTYMQDIDGQHELTPNSRVSLHWSSKGDGNYDQHTIFADHLILPRMILPLADGVLINETDTSDIYLYQDTNGDGVADKKTLWYKGGPRGGNLEHQPSGLIWCLDNWLYSAVNSYRLRLDGTNILKEPTASNGGQWGVAQDNYGKQWFVNAGGEQGPVNFQTPIVYGAFRARNQFPPDYLEVWPLVGWADVQGGYSRFRPSDKTLNHVTASCGGEIFRGDRLPEDVRGDLFYAEPVGRMVRRAKVEVKDGLTYLHNPYDHSEFLRSTDANFRPVNMITAPDGTLYIVDMYRGIIQEGNWVRPGAYLRKVVEQYSMDKNFGRGRIWRLRHKDFKAGPLPHMSHEPPAELVGHLSHPNGFWRDNAQKLLVLREDQSATPQLVSLARSSPNELARIHAIWTLEGMNALTAEFVREKLKDPNPQVRVAAIRASETLIKKGDKTLVADLREAAHDGDSRVVIQSILTAHLLNIPDSKTFIEQTAQSSSSEGVKEIARQLLAPPPPPPGPQFNPAERKLLAKGETIYKELCFACHGPNGKGMPVDGKPGQTLAPPFAGSKTVLGQREGIVKVLLKGLTGPVNGKTYEAQMVPMESNYDEWIAAVTSYVRNSFGNHATLISTNEVAKVRAKIKDRTDPWSIEELYASLPQPIPHREQWMVSASHNSGGAKSALDGNINSRWDTGASQAPGMWYKIELPEAATISCIDLESGPSPLDFPRGYKVEASDDGASWNTIVAAGKGSYPNTEINFAPVKTKFLRIVQTGAVDGLFWSIHELHLYAPAPQTAPKLVKKPSPAYE